jgi:putative ABC transport system permease protein
MVLVLVVTLVWTVLWFLDLVTSEKSKNLKGIVTERWQLPSQMPYAYATTLSEGAASKPGDVKPVDSMTWQFFGGSLEPDTAKRTRDNLVFFFCLEPVKALTMMDGLDELSGQERADLEKAIQMMNEDHRRVVIGKDRLAAINKKVGERIKLYSINFNDIVMEDLEILATFPDGRYNQNAIMHRELLNDTFEKYKIDKKKAHPLANRTLNLVWFKVPDMAAYEKVAEQISNSPLYKDPAVKCETASSGVSTFLDAYRDLLWFMRWPLGLAILATMSLVIANAISISVRERRTEMAVLKVLGFSPLQILFLVLGEAVLVGAGSGFLSAGLTWLIINGRGGINFPIAFFPRFYVPGDALWWGPALGGLTALAGSILPAWSASTVKVTDVFSKIS